MLKLVLYIYIYTYLSVCVCDIGGRLCWIASSQWPVLPTDFSYPNQVWDMRLIPRGGVSVYHVRMQQSWGTLSGVSASQCHHLRGHCHPHWSWLWELEPCQTHCGALEEMELGELQGQGWSSTTEHNICTIPWSVLVLKITVFSYPPVN